MGKRIYSWWNGNYGAELRIKLSDADSCSHSGDCESDVRFLLQQKYISKQFQEIPADLIAQELKQYSAWDDTELSDSEMNQVRILWIACCDIHEEKFN